MRKNISAALLCCFCLIIAGTVVSYAANAVSPTQILLLNYDPGSEAMGGSLASMSGNPLSFTNNPSSNFSVLSSRLDFSGLSAFDGIYGGAVAFMMPTKYGNFTAAFAYTDFDAAKVLTADAVELKRSAAFYLNYVYPFFTDIPIYKDMGGAGITIKGYQLSTDDSSKLSFLTDIGGHYKLDMVFDGLWGFAALKNLGNDIEIEGAKSFEVPGSFNLALRYNVPVASRLAFTGDVMQFFSEGTGFAIGAEISPVYPVTLKAGWRDYGDYVNWGPTLGLFLEFDSFNIGYSFASMFDGYLPKHTINFGFMFGNIADKNKAFDYYLGYNFNKAKEAYNRKDYISSRQQLEEILAVYPDNQPSKDLLKQIVYELDVYDRNLDIQLNRWVRRAELALHQNNLVKARNYYYRVLGIDPENESAEAGLAEVNKRLRVVELQENRKKHEKEIIALWTEAMSFYNNGQFIFAKDKLSMILEIDPENAGAIKYLAIIQTQVSKVTDLQADKMFTQGMEYYNMADYDRAAKYFNAVYAADPKRLDAKEYYDLSRKALNLSITEMSSKDVPKGQIKSRLADKDDSVLSSNQKIQKEMETSYNQAVDLFNKGSYENSLKAFVALREKAIKNSYYDLNQPIREYTSKCRDNISSGYFKEAVSFIKIDKNEEAMEKIKKTLEYNKDYTPAIREYERLIIVLSQKYYDMGIKAYSSGQKSKALEHLEKSLEYNPKKIETKKALDRIKALGD